MKLGLVTVQLDDAAPDLLGVQCLSLVRQSIGVLQSRLNVFEPIVVSAFFDDVRRGFKSALLLGVLVFVLLFIPLGVVGAGNLTVWIIAIMTIVYYRELRERILVSDLLNGGRTFRCDSIVELIDKEAYLEHVSQYLRQVLESAKHWDEREIIPIKPLRKEEAKKAVLKAFHG